MQAVYLVRNLDVDNFEQLVSLSQELDGTICTVEWKEGEFPEKKPTNNWLLNHLNVLENNEPYKLTFDHDNDDWHTWIEESSMVINDLSDLEGVYNEYVLDKIDNNIKYNNPDKVIEVAEWYQDLYECYENLEDDELISIDNNDDIEIYLKQPLYHTYDNHHWEYCIVVEE